MRMQQHVLDDRIGALAVLNDFVEVTSQRGHQLCNLAASLFVQARILQSLLELINQFGRNSRKIIDEVKRVFDLVRDTGGELTQRGKLLCLYQAVLRGAQII